MTATVTTDPGLLEPAPFPVVVLICGECGARWRDHLDLASARASNGYDQPAPTLQDCLQLKQAAGP